MTRLPIRVRLTAAFALAMVLVLAGTGLFVYLRQAEDLDEAVNVGLRSRAAAVAALARPSQTPIALAGGGAAGVAEESFAQRLAPDGRVLDTTSTIRGPALERDEVRRARRGELLLERPVPGIEGRARILARPLKRGDDSAVLVVGQSLDDRNEVLESLVTSFGVGGPVAVLLASLLGYALASAGMRPVEAMRRRAAEVSLWRDDERLPLPTARDEIRRLGETLNEMLDRLARSFERERRFVTDASHELRTPIAVVKTELEGALRMGGHTEEVREALVAAVEECDHLAHLADDLLVMARAAEGRLPVRRVSLPVRPLLEDLRARFADRAAQQGRRIDVDAPPELVAHADPLRVRQALGNLVDNALRHGAGTVLLAARRRPDGIELEVRDEGPGFAADIADRAFERFARGDQARTYGGSGLGMAIVRAIAEAHGGRAGLAPGPGGAVALWLPDPDRDPDEGASVLRAPEPPTASAAAASATTAPSSRTGDTGTEGRTG